MWPFRDLDAKRNYSRILCEWIDQRFNAARLSVTGAGAADTLDSVAAQVHELLTEPRWRAAAETLAAQQYASQPAQVAAELPGLSIG